MDRSTKATLSTYNTWIQIGRLQTIYQLHGAKFIIIAIIITNNSNLIAAWPILISIMSQWKWWTTLLSQHGFRLRGVQS